MGSCGMSCMRRDKRVIVEREGEAKHYHLPGASSSSGFKRIQADNASINVFLEYARALTKDKKFKEALSVISLCSQMASLSTEAIQEFGAELIDFYSVHIGKGSFNTDPWSCCICATVLVDAITLGSCGHSVCKKCVLRDLSSACKKCGTAYEPFNTDPMDEESNIKLSILVCELTDKYWEKEKQAVQLRNEGNKLFQRGDVEASLVKYSEAYQPSKEDHLITSNRSHAFFKAGKLEDALEDAERTIALKPDWGKGYFRKGRLIQPATTDPVRFHLGQVRLDRCPVRLDPCSSSQRPAPAPVFKIRQSRIRTVTLRRRGRGRRSPSGN